MDKRRRFRYVIDSRQIRQKNSSAIRHTRFGQSRRKEKQTLLFSSFTEKPTDTSHYKCAETIKAFPVHKEMFVVTEENHAIS